MAADISQSLWAVPNPVIPRVADCGVMRYQGRYYISGYKLGGRMRVSDDLVHWSDPVHVFSMHNTWTNAENNSDREIHACDMTYHNGQFHFYWSVNHFPLRQIGHAIATQPTGPYREPVTDHWFDGRIDPHLLIAEDGACYFYTVKFTDGNVIWGQAMRDPWTLSGRPKPLLSALAGTWEQRDGGGIRVNEAPWVVFYRDRYYLLYNANHTAARYGHYAIGCAEARHPLGFSNASKYTHPVLKTSPAASGRTTMPQGRPALVDQRPARQTRISNCGQPSVVRGPNGFEWWIVYFAIYDGGPKSQAIDRVLFVDRHLRVDGPTDVTTPGDHPPPALPTWRALFRPGENVDWVSASRANADAAWRLGAGQLLQTSPSGHQEIAIPSRPARHYLFAASCRMPRGSSGGQAGLVAARWDAQHDVRVGLQHARKRWFYQIRSGAAVTEKSFVLPAWFDDSVAHTWKVLRNGTSLRIMLDGRPAPGKAVVQLPHAGPALPGLFTEQTSSRFAGLTYTVGWDEWDGLIGGWRPAAPGEAAQGEWQAGRHGLQVTAGSAAAVTLKGDLLDQYEFQVQLTAVAGRPGTAATYQPKSAIGSYPVYIDSQNYLRTMIELTSDRLLVEGKVRGEPVALRRFALPRRSSYHLRTVRRGGWVFVSVDGVQVGQVADVWSAAQVGLTARAITAQFNDITRYEIR